MVFYFDNFVYFSDSVVEVIIMQNDFCGVVVCCCYFGFWCIFWYYYFIVDIQYCVGEGNFLCMVVCRIGYYVFVFFCIGQ